jgi:hypothetical protein
LRFDHPTYKVGDHVKAVITYRNASASPIRVVPDLPWYPAARLPMKRIADGREPKIITPGEMPSLNFEGIAKSASLLRSGASVTDVIEADLSETLPDFYEEKKPALYLVFGGHASKLPGVGVYNVEALIHSPHDSVIARYVDDLFKPPRLWIGTARSPTVRVEFTKR